MLPVHYSPNSTSRLRPVSACSTATRTPGNFMLLEDGRLGVIDFGAAAPFPNGLPRVLGTMVRLAVEEQFDELTELLRADGFVIPGRTVTDKEIADYLLTFY